MRVALSQYVRLIQTQRRDYLEAVAREKWFRLDAELLAIASRVWDAPCDEEELVRAAAASLGTGADVTERLRAMVRGLLENGVLVREGTREDWAAIVARAVGDWPGLAQIELSGHCPMTCAMCAKGNGELRRPPGFMELGIFKRIIDEVRHTPGAARPFELHNLGESLLHPDIVAMVRYGTAAGLKQSVSTNPVFLTVEMYRALADAGIQQIVICVDGLDAPTLEAIRGPAAHGERALANVEEILALRRKLGESTPHLVLQMLKMKRNRHQHALFASRLKAEENPGVTPFLKELEANTPASLLLADSTPYTFFCMAAWTSLAVLWDGRVVPCGYDYNCRNVLGDMHHDSLYDIWHGEKLQALRERVIGGTLAPDEPCYACKHRPDRYRRPPLTARMIEPHFW